MQFHMKPDSNGLEASIVREFVEGKKCPRPPLANGMEPRTIIDIGAHVGAAACWFHCLWPNARIICYEPSSETRRFLAANAPFAEIHPEAIASVSGSAVLYDSKAPCMRSLFDAAMRGTGERVPLLSASDAFKKHPQADVIKVDAEGAECDILRSATGSFAAAAVVYLEFHRWHDRLLIDSLLAPTHILFHGHVEWSVNRGELGYIRKDAIDSVSLHRDLLP